MDKLSVQEIDPHLYDLPLVKMELDETLQEYLSSSKYKPSTKSIDVRIGIGLITTVLTVISHFLFKNPAVSFYRSAMLSLLCVFWAFVYFESIIMRFFFYHTFSGTDRNNQSIKVVTKIERTDPLYTVLVYFNKKEIPNKIAIDVRTVYKGNLLLLKKYRNILDEGMQ